MKSVGKYAVLNQTKVYIIFTYTYFLIVYKYYLFSLKAVMPKKFYFILNKMKNIKTEHILDINLESFDKKKQLIALFL